MKRKAFTLVELLVAMAILAILAGILMPGLRSAKESGNAARCVSNLRQIYLANVLYAEDHGGQFVLAAEDINSPGGGVKRWHGTRLTPADPFDPATGPLVSYLGKSGKIKECLSFKNFVTSFEAGGGGYGYNEVYVGGRGDLYDVTSDPNAATHSLSLNDQQALNLSHIVMFADAGLPQSAGVISEYSFIEPPFWESPPGTVTAMPSSPTMHFRHKQRAQVVWCDGHVSSEAMSSTTPSNPYGGDNNKYRVGWFGPLLNNAHWKNP